MEYPLANCGGSRIRWGDTQDLRWWLTAQAVHCDILEPKSLRSEIESTVEKGLERVGRHSTE
ncbi:WYL domain-containing protein [Marinobacter sp. DY40_1A1]|uniref:WYL domain-containing protein n=1 Tax=Marinobacter sp. DY40_1A1 TaxID=2583229 RepID=UPI001D129577|nr:WYL domain-containing protein [Marinobacter sp. DY40_1A1]